MVSPGDDLVGLIIDSAVASDLEIRNDDVIIIAQKIVSKAENRYLDLNTVIPSEEAKQLAVEVDKEPEKVQAILNESNEVVRKRPGVLIVEHKLGFVQANAGIDQSNIDHSSPSLSSRSLSNQDQSNGTLENGTLNLNKGIVDSLCLLLPEDPDKSAREIREGLKQRLGATVGVIINDSLGRAWRNGSLGLAIGVAGFTALEDHIGGSDIFGRELLVTEVGAADEMAAGASLVMGQTSEKTPVVLVRGYQPKDPRDETLRGVQPLIRAKEMDLFR